MVEELQVERHLLALSIIVKDLVGLRCLLEHCRDFLDKYNFEAERLEVLKFSRWVINAESNMQTEIASIKYKIKWRRRHLNLLKSLE